MNTSIYNLTYDFIQQNGHYLVFSEKGRHPLANIDLVSLEMKMIQSNSIPYLLPIQVEEIDFQVRILYKLSGKRMLSLFLKENRLSMNDYYTFFLNIISVLEDSQLYMLNKQNYILKEDFIFIGRDIHDISLTYLPIREFPEKASVIDDLKALLLNVAGEVVELEGTAFQTILSYAKDPGFNLEGLKGQLRELQVHSPSSVPEKIPPEKSASEQSDLESIETSSPDSRPLWAHEVVENNYNFSQDKVVSEDKFSLGTVKPNRDPLPTLSQREKIFMFGFLFVALALIWKLYSSFPNSTALSISSVLSIFVIVATVVFWKFWRPGFQIGGNAEAIEKERTEPDKDLDIEVDQLEENNNPYLGDSDGSVQTELPIQQQKDSLTNKENYYQGLEQKTTLLPRIDETVILNEMFQPQSPYLTVKRDTETERIEIQKEPFIIGRKSSSVEYVEDSPGVSRSHIEISQQEGIFVAKDLGSKNGSLYNEQPMVPYKTYELRDQDELTIGKVLFVFHITH